MCILSNLSVLKLFSSGGIKFFEVKNASLLAQCLFSPLITRKGKECNVCAPSRGGGGRGGGFLIKSSFLSSVGVCVCGVCPRAKKFSPLFSAYYFLQGALNWSFCHFK